MLLTPIIERELRVEARRPWNYWTRVLAGSAGLWVVLILGLRYSWLEPQAFGHFVFARLFTLLFYLIWLIVPLQFCDLMAREKRDGTLPLLFLTPLTPASIVLGKALAQLLRASTIMLVLIPLMTLPILAGGLQVRDFVNAAGILS